MSSSGARLQLLQQERRRVGRGRGVRLGQAPRLHRRVERDGPFDARGSVAGRGRPPARSLHPGELVPGLVVAPVERTAAS